MCAARHEVMVLNGGRHNAGNGMCGRWKGGMQVIRRCAELVLGNLNVGGRGVVGEVWNCGRGKWEEPKRC